MKRLMLAVAFTCVLSVSALAGDTQTPPGETHTPPGEVNSPPGEILTPPGQSLTGETQGPSILATVLLTIITWPR